MTEPRVATEREAFERATATAPPGARAPVEVRVSVVDPFEAYRRARDDTGGFHLETTGGQSGWGYFGVDPVDRLTVWPDDIDDARAGESTSIRALVDRLDAIVVSPGPGTPREAGVSMPIFRELAYPTLGVRLGTRRCVRSTARRSDTPRRSSTGSSRRSATTAAGSSRPSLTASRSGGTTRWRSTAPTSPRSSRKPPTRTTRPMS